MAFGVFATGGSCWPGIRFLHAGTFGVLRGGSQLCRPGSHRILEVLAVVAPFSVPNFDVLKWIHFSGF